MTTKTFKVYKGYSNYITIKKPRYWTPYTYRDKILPGLLAYNITDDGLSHKYNLFCKDNSIEIDSVEEKNGYIWAGNINIPVHSINNLKKANFTVNGSPTFSNFIASGFTASDYLTGNKTIPHSEFFPLNGVRLITRFKYTDTSQCAILMFHKSDKEGVSSVGTVNNNLFVWGGGNLVRSSTTLTPNTWYWLQTIWNGTNMLGYIYTGETAPDDLSQWTLFATTNDTVFNVLDYFNIGIGASSEYFRGNIDLLNTRIDTGVNNAEGVTVWNTLWKALE